MSGGVNNQNGLFRQANGYGPFQQRAQQVLGQKKGSGSKNLFLKTQEDLIEDATYRTVGKIVDEEPRLGKNPHVVNSFKHHRSNVAARIALNANKGSDYVDKAWAKQAKDSQAKKSDRKFATIDNDPVAKSAKPALSLEEKIERLEQKVANLEEQVVQERFTSNPKVSFPESLAQPKNMKNADSHYAAHNKAYNSMLAGLSKTTNRIGLA